ncbi:MAG: type 3 dihydrofolate reductase [Gammaproteobacteria bacterium]|nr:type 3 dihydrofolate reductase [Gammaproteobacteria bacterium]MDH5802050.1 type 3 dihydrofolate reductase [Gammaproteobacteria bacterium]
MSRVSLIWAMSDAGVIGIENRLPWKLSGDMKWFRQHTLGKPIIMGRKTYESFGSKALPQRTNIIVSRQANYKADDANVCGSLEQAIELAGDTEEIMVIGGASIYQQALPLAGRLYMTLVHADVQGDAHFPAFDTQTWGEVLREEHQADEKNQFPYTFIILERR